MELSPMQYKGFVWPHNPRTYSITYHRAVAVHKVPFGRYAMQDVGMSYRVMQGEGEFFGEDAYDTFRALASVFYENGPGTLLHPVWQSAQAYFVDLALAQEPRLLLLDEPTNHLDVRAQLRTLSLLRDLAADGITVVAALHDLNLAAEFCDHVVVLTAGRIAASGETVATLDAELIETTYGVRADVLTHPRSGRPLIAFSR